MSTTETKSKPILFSAPMVQAILAGRKTMTRRVVKEQPKRGAYIAYNVILGWNIYRGDPLDGNRDPIKEPYQIGDRLYVKESLVRNAAGLADYVADGSPVISGGEALAWPWRVKHLTGRYMPRKLSRITLRIKSVGVERLQDISEADAVAEGFERDGGSAYCWFLATWQTINGKESLDANPWVWVVSFHREEAGK